MALSSWRRRATAGNAVAVTLFLPQGIVGAWQSAKARLADRFARRTDDTQLEAAE